MVHDVSNMYIIVCIHDVRVNMALFPLPQPPLHSMTHLHFLVIPYITNLM